MSDIVKIAYIQQDGKKIVAESEPGRSVRDLAMAVGVSGILGECGGNAACATCHVKVADEWIDKVGRLEIDSSEDGTLDLSDARSENSRLSCQIPITPELDGLVVTVATDL